MPSLISADLDLASRVRAETACPVIYGQWQPLVLDTSSGRSIHHLYIDYDSALAYVNEYAVPRMLTITEREAMERALWRTVEVLDDGIEE